MVSEIVNISTQFTDEEIENYLLAVYTGLLSTYSLSLEYHERIGALFYDEILKGFGGLRFNDIEKEIFEGLAKNVYVFSSAKQYSQVREMSNYIRENVSFSDFKKVAGDVFEDYNKNYLSTELNTAITQSQNAKKWAKIQAEKEIFPLLQYKTQSDGLVRDSHAALHNIIKPVNDPFWSSNMPANGWGCRCFVQQLDEGEVTEDTPVLSDDEQPELFRMNPGKDKVIFDEKKHPYFSIARGDSELRRNNYNLPTP